MHIHFQRFFAGLLALWWSGCALPEGGQTSPEELHYLAISSRVSADIERQWDLLHPDVRARITALHRAETKARRLVLDHYPKDQQQATLALIDSAGSSTLATPRDTFSQLLATSELEALSLSQRLGARVSTLVKDGDSAIVETRAGQSINVRQHDDSLWYLALTEQERTALDNAIAQAERNLAKVQVNVATLDGNPVK